MNYSQLEYNFVAWAANQADMRAGIVIGSRARSDHPADEWSDLDIILFVRNASRYAANADWLVRFGNVWALTAGKTGRGDPEWMLLFAGGLKLDVVLVEIAGDAPIAQLLDRSPYHDVARRGMRVLFNKAQPESRAAFTFAPQVSTSPDEEAFLAVVNRAFMEVVRAAKLARRGEVWRAKQQCDCALKAHLLCVLEWHTQILRHVDPWYDGHFLEEWVDRRWLAALPGTFAVYDPAEIQRALLVSLRLFGQAAGEVAAHLAFVYPQETEAQITAWLLNGDQA